MDDDNPSATMGLPAKRRPTIHDVAAESGVSRQTVTRALNGEGRINEATKQRVLAVTARLGYRPSRFARNLVERDKPFALGLLVMSFRNPYYTDIAGDMLASAGARGWQVVMASPEAGSEERAVIALANQVDVLIGHFTLGDATLLEIGRGMPVVKLEERAVLAGVHSVEVDIRGGLRDLIDQLRGRGARRIGMLDSNYSESEGHSYSPSPRREWFEEFVDPSSAASVVVGDESIGGGAAAFVDLMTRFPDVDSVIAFNDMMAIGALQGAESLQMSVPDRVRIVGIDGLTLGEAVRPQLSTLSIDRHAVVKSALDIVDRLAANRFATLQTIARTTKPSIVWRGSA